MFSGKGTTKHCCYGTCRSDSRYGYLPHMGGVKWFSFPKPHRELEKCKRWVHLCGRKGFTIDSVRKYTFICSKHFPGGNFDEDPYPATAKNPKIQRKPPAKRHHPETLSEVNPLKRRKKHAEVAEIMNLDTGTSISNLDTSCQSGSSKVVNEEDSTEISAQNNVEHVSDILMLVVLNTCATETSNIIEMENTTHINSSNVHIAENSKQIVNKLPSENESTSSVELLNSSNVHIAENSKQIVNKLPSKDESTSSRELLKLKLQNKILKNRISVLESTPKPAVMPKIILRYDDSITDEKMLFYTGLTHTSFKILLDFLGDDANRLIYWRYKQKSQTSRSGAPRKLQPADELLCTLMRLRLGLLVQDLAYRFNISGTSISSIVMTWVQFIFNTFKSMEPLMLPSREHIAKNLPSCFKPYKNIRIIIDATEFFCQSSKDFRRQGNLFSQYKHHTTMKVLIGIVPTGGIAFVSPVYEGSISDRELFIKSDLINRLEPGDLVLADRGFIIRDILQTVGVHLNIPPFLKGRKKFSVVEEVETRKIAKARIHVERVIGRMKVFKILSNTVPLSLSHIFSQMVFVVACLVNFQSDIVD